MTRFDFHARVQHGLLAVSLAVLILTGFPVKFAAQPWARAVVRLFGSFEGLLAVHLAAAAVLAFTALYYLSAVSLALARRRLDFSIVPRLRDFGDFGRHLGYLIGLRPDAPRFGKFTWWEKFEFWAVVWGTAVMGASGLVLVFPELAGRFVPRWAVGALRVAHSNEAVLAFLAVVFGHTFAVHFSPHVFPGSTVWLNGRATLSQLHEDHAMMYEVLVSRNAAPPRPMKESRWVRSRPLIVTELAAYGLLIAAVYVAVVPHLLGA
ncbi:MAG: cytochrome b/b6 domain-containing protein [Bacillota bacterium]|nr:MAG: cytochrome b/b6 domain-containing protein [Bacillota bacterium]